MGNSVHSAKLYVLDYGQADYRKDDAVLNLRHDGGATQYNVRVKKEFVGDLRFASIDAHDYVEQTEKNDVESLAYILLYLATGYLPWGNSTDVEDIGDQKEALRGDFIQKNMFPRVPSQQRFSGEASATWLKEMRAVMEQCISPHLSVARDHGRENHGRGNPFDHENRHLFDYDGLADPYGRLLGEHDIVVSSHYDWHDKGSVEAKDDGLDSKKLEPCYNLSAVQDAFHHGANAQRDMQHLARRCVRAMTGCWDHVAGSGDENMASCSWQVALLSPEKQAEVLGHMSVKHRDDWLELLKDTDGYETVLLVLRKNEAASRHVSAIRSVSSTGQLPVRVILPDKTFVTVLSKVTDRVKDVSTAVAKKCHLRYYDTYALYALPPARSQARSNLPKERQMEHLPSEDSFVAALNDVDRRIMDDTDKEAGAKTGVYFVKRVTYPDLNEEQRYTPSYGYMAYMEAQKQVMSGLFGTPGRAHVGHLENEHSVPWKVMFTHGDCIRLAVLMLLYENNEEVNESVEFSSTPEKRARLKAYIPPSYIGDLEQADASEKGSFFGFGGEKAQKKAQKGAVDNLAEELQREYRSFGYQNRNLTRKQIEDMYLKCCKRYAHFGAQFFWVKEMLNRGGFETDKEALNLHSVETTNAWIGVGPAGLIACQGETRELFCCFALDDVISYEAGATERGNLVLQIEVCTRLEGRGHHKREPTVVKAAFKTEGAFQLADLLTSYKQHPPSVVRLKEPGGSEEGEGATRAIYQAYSSSDSESSDTDSGSTDYEAELAEVQLAHESAAEGVAYFDYDAQKAASGSSDSDTSGSGSDSDSSSSYSDTRSVAGSAVEHSKSTPGHRMKAETEKERAYLDKVKYLTKKTKANKLKKQTVLKKEEAKWTKKSIGKVEDGFDKGMMLEAKDPAAALGSALGSKLVDEYSGWAMKNEDSSDASGNASGGGDTTDYASQTGSVVSRLSKRKGRPVGYTPKESNDPFPKTYKVKASELDELDKKMLAAQQAARISRLAERQPSKQQGGTNRGPRLGGR